jgi:hypothetical protein
MVVLRSSVDYSWPWSHVSVDSAEAAFEATYPSIHARFKPMESELRKRQDQGRHWWELRACAYWADFEKPKLLYQEIQFHPGYALDTSGQYGNNKTFFIPVADTYLLAVLNSPLVWWYNWRYLPHMKDEALSPVAFLMESLPIAEPTDAIRRKVEEAVHRLVEITHTQQTTRHQLLDWLRVEHDVSKPSLKLRSLLDLDSDAFVAEVRKVRGRKRPLSSAALANLRDEHTRSIAPMRALATEALRLEHRLSDLVNAAYRLTPAEIALLWQTAPPRMPVGGAGEITSGFVQARPCPAPSYRAEGTALNQPGVERREVRTPRNPG